MEAPFPNSNELLGVKAIYRNGEVVYRDQCAEEVLQNQPFSDDPAVAYQYENERI